MKKIKNFDQFSNLNEELFGGKSGNVIIPKIDDLVKKLNEMKSHLDGTSNTPYSVDEMHKIENMYEYIVGGISLESVYKSSLQSEKIKKKMQRGY